MPGLSLSSLVLISRSSVSEIRCSRSKDLLRTSSSAAADPAE